MYMDETRLKGLYHQFVECDGMPRDAFLRLYPQARGLLNEEAAPDGLLMYNRLVLEGHMTTEHFQESFPSAYKQVLVWLNEQFPPPRQDIGESESGSTARFSWEAYEAEAARQQAEYDRILEQVQKTFS